MIWQAFTTLLRTAAPVPWMLPLKLGPTLRERSSTVKAAPREKFSLWRMALGKRCWFASMKRSTLPEFIGDTLK